MERLIKFPFWIPMYSFFDEMKPIITPLIHMNVIALDLVINKLEIW